MHRSLAIVYAMIYLYLKPAAKISPSQLCLLAQVSDGNLGMKH